MQSLYQLFRRDPGSSGLKTNNSMVPSMFNDLMVVGLAVAAVLLLVSPVLKRMMHGVR